MLTYICVTVLCRGAADCYSYLSNRVTVLVRACLRRYYECWLVCDDPSCGRRTMQQSVKGSILNSSRKYFYCC